MKNIQNFLKNHIWGLLVHAWVPLQHTSNNWTQPEQTFYSTQTQDSTVRTLTDCPSCVFCIHSIKNKDSFKVEWLDLDYPVSSRGLTSSCFENLIRDLRSLTNQLTQTHRPSHVTDSTSQTELELKAAGADWMMHCCPCMKFTHAPRRSSKCSLRLQTHSHRCVDENFLDRHTRKHASLVLLTTLHPDLRPVNLKRTSAGGHMKAPHSLHPTRN